MDYNGIMDFRSNMPVNQDREKVKEQIQKWLLEEGFKVESVTDKESHFKFIAENDVGRKVMIYQPIKKADQIIIFTVAPPTQEQLNKLLKMRENERNEILWKLRFGLLNREVGFNPIIMPLQNIQIYSAVYYDGLTKNYFIDKLLKVGNALMFVFWTIDRELGEREPTTRPTHIV